MESIRVDILNPKAKKLLQDLEDLELIAINKPARNLSQVLNEIRSRNNDDISIEEITSEVEKVRSARYASE